MSQSNQMGKEAWNAFHMHNFGSDRWARLLSKLESHTHHVAVVNPFVPPKWVLRELNRLGAKPLDALDTSFLKGLAVYRLPEESAEINAQTYDEATGTSGWPAALPRVGQLPGENLKDATTMLMTVYTRNRSFSSAYDLYMKTSKNRTGYYLLDAASLCPPLLLAPEPGQRVLDMCAAPGGKSLLLAYQLFGKEALRALEEGKAEFNKSLLLQPKSLLSHDRNNTDTRASVNQKQHDFETQESKTNNSIPKEQSEFEHNYFDFEPYDDDDSFDESALYADLPENGGDDGEKEQEGTQAVLKNSESPEDNTPNIRAKNSDETDDESDESDYEEVKRPPGKLILNDGSRIRAARLQKVVRDYIPFALLPDITVVNVDATSTTAGQNHSFGTITANSIGKGNQLTKASSKDKGEGLPQGQFDRVLIDAPCSSDRHLLFAPDQMATWSVQATKQQAARQISLLKSGLRSLKKNGRLVYSTCSLSPFENDGAVQQAISSFGKLQKFKTIVKRTIKATKESVIEEKIKYGNALFRVQPVSLGIGEPTTLGWIILPDQPGCSWGPLYMSVIERID